MPVIDLANISLIRFAEQSGTPSTPAATFSGLYMKSDGLYTIDDVGLVTGPLISGSGVLLADGSVALAGAWDMGSQILTNVNIDSGVITGITDLLPADGGTGRSSHTAYAVLAGGTTGTAAQQSISGVGTSGQVLTSNGAAALPTWQAAGVTGAIILDPATSVRNTIFPAADVIPFVVKSATGGSSKLMQFRNGSATVVKSVTVEGWTAIGTAGNLYPFEVHNLDVSTTARLATSIDSWWTPTSTSGAQARKIGAVITANFDGTHTPASGYFNALQVYCDVNNTGLLDMRAFMSSIINDGGGTVVNGTAVFVESSWGSITNVYGLYVDDQTNGVTNNYSLYTNAGDIVFNAANGAGNVTVGGTPISVNYDLGLVGDGVLAQKETTTPTADAGYGKIYTQSDNKLYFQDGAGDEHIVHGFPSFKSYTATTQGLGVSPDIYLGGFYYAPVADANLTQGSTTQAYGNANVSYAAHAFIVAGNAGSVDTGVVGLRITGTTITDTGTRATGQTVVLSADITTLETNLYLETTEKWLGTITYELYVVSGSPTTYSLDFNYGFTKYEDWGNNDFTVTEVEATGLAGANDSDFDICLIRHSDTGWIYSAAAFDPMLTVGSLLPRVFYSLVTNHATDDQLIATQHFAWKLTGLDLFVEGSSTAGYILCLSSSVNNAIEYCNIHVGIEY